MINHARTLLMNVTGQDFFPDVLGEELIDPLYRPVRLSSPLLNVRRLLFGTEPDRLFLNYRVRQLLSLIHSNELVQFVTDLDPRVTYSFADEPYFDPNLFRPVVTPQTVSSGASTQFYLFGSTSPPDQTGRMSRTWDIELLDGSTASVRLRGEAAGSNQSYTVSGTLSSRMTLPGSGMEFQIRDSVFTPGQGPQFRVDSLARPTVSLGSLLSSVGRLGVETLVGLFGTTTPTGGAEPLRTFRRLYEEQYGVDMRLGAVVLALIYQTEARRIA